MLAEWPEPPFGASVSYNSLRGGRFWGSVLGKGFVNLLPGKDSP